MVALSRVIVSFRRWGVVAALWAGANGAALWGIDLYDSWRLEEEFHVPANVIRAYQFRTTDVALRGAEGRATLWYRFRPPSRWAGDRSVPLLVYLHGAGERGSDNVRQLGAIPRALCDDKMQRRYPCAVLAPQCPAGWSWIQTPVLDGVLQMIDDALSDRRIDPSRVYLTGFSMGGHGAWELAMRAPGRFAAVVPMCGGGDERLAGRLIDTAVWAVHGADDEVVPASESQSMVAAVEAAGGSPRYLELPGVGHSCWQTVFSEESEVLEWMFRQSRPLVLAAFHH